MSTVLEVLGMSLPYSSGIPAVYPGKIAIVLDESPLNLRRKGKGMSQGSVLPQDAA
jgi:dihydroxyacid dehydratase/phosphogluconate dehydratase